MGFFTKKQDREVSATADRRHKAYRLQARLPAQVERPVNQPCETVDISVLGVLLDTRLPLREGEVFVVRIEIPQDEKIAAAARVVRLEPNATAAAFLNLTHYDQGVLQRYIAEEQRRILRDLDLRGRRR